MIAPPIGNAELKAFAETKVNLPKEEADARREKVNQLREQLQKWVKDNPDCGIVKSYLSGSLAKGTALKTSSDVDLALYVKYDGERKATPQFINWIAERLRKAYPQMAPDQIQPTEFAVTITFKGAGVDVDVVPVFYEGDPDDKGWLVSKRTGELLMTSVPRHLEFIRKRKNDQPTHFAQVVRLLKAWAQRHKQANSSFRLKSFMIELICAHLADNGTKFDDYPAALTAFFNYILNSQIKERVAFTDYYPKSKLPKPAGAAIEIFDPINPDNNVAAQYTENNRQLVIAAAQDALDAINEAHTAATKELALNNWQRVFGPSFRG